jgi:pullulanase/glycogen debranching enzyme
LARFLTAYESGERRVPISERTGQVWWGNDRPPRIPWSQTGIYETHVKGFTARHHGVAKDQRGTYGGLVAASWNPVELMGTQSAS